MATDYDRVIEVSPFNQYDVICGGLNMVMSNDGDDSWNAITDWTAWGSTDNYVHADNHFCLFDPTNSQIVYECTDGGTTISTSTPTRQTIG